ncbi:MAG TPA: von willebrand factor type a [Bacteroidales bacterium]|nr:MAG: hypothetical protein A2W98_12175 [Bacteroidetes bacterium GWF2_33_38]OFY75451.1 MAG: hypothetical protein A2265_11520 [Bacteroidetes bacterium RIFOXYA12_FULL_33_9]OFY91895.1 MAG: hypothetical protein A2236_06070 [Bacteroidetes bacterium RIFOXYA2_FULL_33_7]HBF88396.1 von willebrand factor type a [Bacteroidales bacterium]
MKLFLNILILLIFAVNQLFAQQPKINKPTTRILFVFDASQSMLMKWESDTKINIARKFLIEMIDSLEQMENVQMAIRIYGHQSPVPPQDCSDTKLEVPFGENNASKIRQKLRFITPKGTTPIAHSLELAGDDFPPMPNSRNVIILITDGIEACDGDPCAISEMLQKKGIALRPFVIGIGLDLRFKESFKCIGKYYDASIESQFKDILGVVISDALNTTTVQVNLLDIQGKPTETNVNMSFFDLLSGKLKYNYIHTINSRGEPDTVEIDPLLSYKMIVHTIPPVTVDGIKLTQGKHTIIPADVPQGYLKLKLDGNNQYNGLTAIVRKSGEMNTLNVQDINDIEKYIIGKYDLEILTLPRILVSDVEIKQSYTTTIDIPKPGLVTFITSSAGFGSLYLETGDKFEWIYNLNPNYTKETIVLQPGSYRVVYRPQNAKRTYYTVEKIFDISSGVSLSIGL